MGAPNLSLASLLVPLLSYLEGPGEVFIGMYLTSKSDIVYIVKEWHLAP